jgi:transposase InsO family protein
VKYAAIKANSGDMAISKCCKLLGASRSGYYEWLKFEKAPKVDEFGLKVVEIFYKFKRRYGAIRIRIELKKEGIKASKKKIRRAMEKYNLVAKATKKFVVRTTDSKHNLPISPNLLMRNFDVCAPNIAWAADLTYIATEFGWRYLAVVIDLFDRSVVGWAMADNMKKELVLDAMKMAVKRRKPPKGLIVHSDRGSQYCSYAYQGLLAKYGCESSMSAKGDPWDNAVVESFFGTFKVELIHGEKWTDDARLRSEVLEYIEIDYNRERQHSALGYISPNEFRQKWIECKNVA